ncbi:MAG TPA: AsmA family protein [Burkholderiales bacterium]|nr:AsmA family protein [Burkholderiales bacterium]
MRALKWIGGAVLILFVALALFFTFGLHLLKGPITKGVTKATGRELVIEGDLRPVWSWVHPRIRAEGVRFANAEWGKADYLVNADVIEATISVLPLLRGRVVLPEVHLEGAELSLEQDKDGRKNWIMEQEAEPKEESRFFVKRVTVNEGRLYWEDAWREHSFEVDLSTDESGVKFSGDGKYAGMPFKAEGHAGHMLSIRDQETPFPIKGELKIGDTAAKLEGTITGLVGFKGIDLNFEQISGKTMADLYWIIGLAFPETSAYKVSGRLIRTDGMWRFEKFAGKVGESDLSGTFQVDTAENRRPFMKADLTAKLLNLADLGPLVGTKEPREGGVLPDMPFDAARWESVDADVSIKAGTIKRPEQLPLENLSTRIQMRDSVLSLNPLQFGFAGGQLTGTVRLDGNKEPIRGDLKMRVKDLQLAKLFPTIKQAQDSKGNLDGLIELAGSGDSVGKLLGSANGKIGIYMDEGKISRFLMELVALDLWDVAQVKLKGDQDVEIRCAIADFAVKDGMAQTNAFVFDTTVTNVTGSGSINLKTEEMDLTLKPQPKDRGIGSLRTPLHIKGTFSEPNVGPDMGKLAARGGGAIALGILNPLLAILPLIQEGKGKDSNCGQLIAQAGTSIRGDKAATARAAKAAKGAIEKAETAETAKKAEKAEKAEKKAASSDQSSASGETAPYPPSQSAR